MGVVVPEERRIRLHAPVIAKSPQDDLAISSVLGIDYIAASGRLRNSFNMCRIFRMCMDSSIRWNDKLSQVQDDERRVFTCSIPRTSITLSAVEGRTNGLNCTHG